jgi:DNA-binding NarL/FixJ family response regulator
MEVKRSAMTGLQGSLKVCIVSSSPIYAGGLQKLIASSPMEWSCEIVLDPHEVMLLSGSIPDVALLAPRDWRELGDWIYALQKQLPLTPWLVLAELLAVGMFAPWLAAQSCIVVDPAGAPGDLCTALRAAASDDCFHLPTHMLSLFAHNSGSRTNGRVFRMPSVTELAISCGVSLGLGNREIADALHVSEATVKTHLHRLMSRLGLQSRARLGALMGKALAGQPPLSDMDSSRLALSHDHFLRGTRHQLGGC